MHPHYDKSQMLKTHVSKSKKMPWLAISVGVGGFFPPPINEKQVWKIGKLGKILIELLAT